LYSKEEFVEGCAFVNRMYVPRIVGTCLCGAVIVSTNYSSMSPLLLALLAFNSLIWAHAARRIALSSAQPFKMEKLNFLFDSLFCGFWIALIQFRPLPSVVIFSMVAMNNIAVGGPKFFVHGLLSKLLGAFAVLIFFGVSYGGNSESDILVCLPVLIVYPLILGLAFYKISSELKQSKHMLRELSNVDALTGLLNRRYWNELVSASMSRHDLISESVLVILDVDRFKCVNDIYGHSSGDKVLCILGDILSSRFRGVDLICRYGGDEFCILITNVSIQEVSSRMLQICDAFADRVSCVFPEAKATLSVGVALWNPSVVNVECWLSLADDNLYKAKNSGRNKIVCGDV